MRPQQKIWTEEHQKNNAIPKLGSLTPGNAVVYFLKNMSKLGIHPPKKVVDIGCGKGRNTIYLAQQGFDVYGMDYIKNAIDQTKQTAHSLGLDHTIKLFVTGIDKRWPFPGNYFDLAIDNYSSIDIETRKGRETYKKELLRTLKPGGYALVAVVSADDEIERQMLKGSEPNSTIWPNGKFQKNYDEEELPDFYRDFQIIDLKKVTKPGTKLGKTYSATNYWLILKK